MRYYVLTPLATQAPPLTAPPAQAARDLPATPVVPHDCVTLGSAPGEAPPSSKKPWTVLYYAAGDDVLGPSQVEVLKSLEQVGTTATVNVAAQLDLGREAGATRRLITQSDVTSSTLASPVLQDLGQVDMTRPKTLSDFIRWGITSFPAEHYMLVIGSLGGGWEGCVQDLGAHHLQSLPQLERGLRDAEYWTGQKMDVIGFDAADMGVAELAHEISSDARLMITSQLNMGTMTSDYASMVTPDLIRTLDGRLAAGQQVSPHDLAATVVEASKSQPDAIDELAATDLSQVPALDNALRELSQAVVASSMTDQALGQLRDSSQAMSYLGNQDLYDLCERIQASPQAEPALKAAAGHCQAVLSTMVIAEQHHGNHTGAHGLSIETLQGHERYQKLSFDLATGWMQAQQRFSPESR
jgi:Clostripain family